MGLSALTTTRIFSGIFRASSFSPSCSCTAPKIDGLDTSSLGAEGIEAVPGRDLLLEDQPEAFADAVNHLLTDPGLAARIGQSARELAMERYSWSGAAQALEGFYRRILEVRSRLSQPGKSPAARRLPDSNSSHPALT